MIVDGEREGLDAQRLARAVEGPVADLQAAPALDRIHHFLEQLFLLRKGLLAAANEEDELPPGILEPLGMDGVAADVVHQVAHAFLVAGALEQLGEARAHAGGDDGRDGRPLRAAGHLRPVDADVEASAPFFPDQRNVPADRRDLAIGGRHAHSQERRDLRAGEIAAGEKRGDQLGRPSDGSEPSELRIRHDPRRIVRSSADLKRPIRPPSPCRRGRRRNDPSPGLASSSRPNRKGCCRGQPQILGPSRNHRRPLDRRDFVHLGGADHGGPVAALGRAAVAATSRREATQGPGAGAIEQPGGGRAVVVAGAQLQGRPARRKPAP